jgi:hypothetical protein
LQDLTRRDSDPPSFLVTPAKTPEPILARLADLAVEFTNTPRRLQFRERFGIARKPTTHKEARRISSEDAPLWEHVLPRWSIHPLFQRLALRKRTGFGWQKYRLILEVYQHPVVRDAFVQRSAYMPFEVERCKPNLIHSSVDIFILAIVFHFLCHVNHDRKVRRSECPHPNMPRQSDDQEWNLRLRQHC